MSVSDYAKSLPLQLLAIIAGVALGGQYAPLWFVRGAYTVSEVLRGVLGLVLPFVVFFFVSSGIVQLQSKAPKILCLLLACVFCSNACIAFITYGVSLAVLPSQVSGLCQEATACFYEVAPFFTFPVPDIFGSVLRSEYMLVFAMATGLFLTWRRSVWAEHGIRRGRHLLGSFFTRVFIPLLPLYVFGFLLKMHHEGVVARLVGHYGSAFFFILALQAIILCSYYVLACGGHFARAYHAFRTAFGSYITAFSTMSSTVAVPVSVEAARKNTGNAGLAHMAMPIMANIHLVGDSIGTPVLAFVTLLVFAGSMPTLGTYAMFVLYFCTAMFAVSGIPGGGIIVMIPVLKQYLGFSQEMVSIMMTLYLLLDAFGTAANVMGDGALVILLNRLSSRCGFTQPTSQ